MSRLITSMFLITASAYVVSSEISIIEEPEKLSNKIFIDTRDLSNANLKRFINQNVFLFMV